MTWQNPAVVDPQLQVPQLLLSSSGGSDSNSGSGSGSGNCSTDAAASSWGAVPLAATIPSRPRSDCAERAGGSGAGLGHAPPPPHASSSRLQLKAASLDKRRYVSCDPVVRFPLIFECWAPPAAAAAAGQAAPSPLQLVIASPYDAVPGFDTWQELG